MTFRQTFLTPIGAHETTDTEVFIDGSNAVILHPVHSSKARAIDSAIGTSEIITLESPKFVEYAGEEIGLALSRAEIEIPRQIHRTGLFLALIPGIIGAAYLALPCIAFWMIMIWMSAPLD